METASRSNHIGRKISRLRELKGFKQEYLAQQLGISQQAVSKLEQSENIEEEVLEKVAKILDIPAEGIKQFSEEAVLNIVATTFNSHDSSTSIAYQSSLNFNPLDKLIEAYEENKKLYERLLQVEREKNELLKGK